jgi:alcohol dehydrogenase
LLRLVGINVTPQQAGDALAVRLRELASAADHPTNLRGLGVSQDVLPQLAEDAATEWTGTFNPRHFDAAGAAEIYRAAF